MLLLASAVLLIGCSTRPSTPPTTPAAAPAPAATPDPVSAACAELARRRAAEGESLPDQAPPPLRIDAVRELFRRAAAFGLSGGVLVARGGKIELLEACGLADHATEEPMRADVVFDVGSVSKPLTAAAVLALEDDGRLRVEDPITRFFADVPADKAAITIHQLLTHTAGFAHDVGDATTHPTRDEAVRQILASELLFAPGEKQAYSNAGYSLLAALVEVAAGQPFEEYERTRLWLPLGMTRTGMSLADRTGAQVADAESFAGPQPARRPGMWSTDGLSWLARGSGGISSSMEELFAWSETLRTGRVLSDASRRKLFYPQAREPLAAVSYYGYGWQVTAAPDGGCVLTHNGSAGYHYDVLAVLPEHDAVLVTFCTQQATPWKDFPERVLGVLAGSDELGFPDVRVAAEPAEAFAGTYELPNGTGLELRVLGGRLAVSATSAEALRLFCPWPTAEPAAVAPLGDRAALVSGLVGAIARGDLAPVLARLPSTVAAVDERAFWTEYWPRWIDEQGAYEGTDLIDTVRVDGSLRTLALIRFARSSTVVGCVHSDTEPGQLYLDTMARRFLRDIVLAPQGGREFLAVHPQTRRATRVVFDGPPEARSLTIVNGSELVTARRAARR